MFTRCSFLGLTLAALLTVPLVSRGESNDRLIQRTYPVADLVIPVVNQSIDDFFLMPEVAEKPCSDKPQPAPQRNKVFRADRSAERNQPTLEKQLIEMIVKTIATASWSEFGGAATIEYFPLGYCLVVNQTAENHESISDMLAALRRLQDVEVAVEIRLVSLPEELYPRVMEMVNLKAAEARPCSASGCKPAGRIQLSHGQKLGYLNDLQIFQLMEAIQGDRRTNVMQAPKVTMFNGQTSVISVTDQQFFVTGVKTVQACANNQTVFVPFNQPFELGVKFALKPTVSADRRSVDLDVKANLANLASENVPVFPVTTIVTPVFEGGCAGQPIPLTQFIQKPQFECQRLDTKVNIPDGATAVYGGWKTTHEVREMQANALVKCLPAFAFFNELLEELTGCTDPLGTVSYHRESQYLVLLVTPRIIVHGEEESVQTGAVASPAPEMNDEETSEPREPARKIASSEQLQRKMVAELLAAYREACVAGNQAEAQKLAHMALALDPLCFHGGR